MSKEKIQCVSDACGTYFYVSERMHVSETTSTTSCIRGIYCFSSWVYRMNCEVPGLMLRHSSQYFHFLLLMSEFCPLSGRRRFELVNSNLWFHEL